MASLLDTGQRSWSTNLYDLGVYGLGNYGVGLGLYSFGLKGVVQNNYINKVKPTAVWDLGAPGNYAFELKLSYTLTEYEIFVDSFTTTDGEYQLSPYEELPAKLEGIWIVSGRVLDPISGWSSWAQVTVTLDLVPPVVPTLNAVTSPSVDFTQVLAGAKQPDDYVLVNDTYVTYPNGVSGSTWKYTLTLSSGLNDVSVLSRDLCGNDSSAVNAKIELATVTPELINKWNAMDEFGFLLNVSRHLGESNLNYKTRLLRYFK